MNEHPNHSTDSDESANRCNGAAMIDCTLRNRTRITLGVRIPECGSARFIEPKSLNTGHFLLLWLWGFSVVLPPLLIPSVLHADENEPSQSVDQSAEKKSSILEDPIDFSNPPTLPDLEPLDRDRLESAIQNGILYLVAKQNSNGSWGSPTRTKSLNIYAPVPGAHHAFRAATTALAISALIESGSVQPSVTESIDKAEQWLFEHIEQLRRASGDAIYNVWGHGYAIQALVRMHGRIPNDEARQERIAALIRGQFQKLERYESVDGGWGYYDFRYQANQPTSSSISFVNGAILVALKEAESIGITPPSRMTQRAIAALQRQKKPDFSYLYGEYLQYRPMRGINRPGGSLGRSQCCNIALQLWGDHSITQNVLTNWLYRLYVRNGWLDIGRKRPVPHEAWMQVAGYFYYFGHYYAALCIDAIPSQDRLPYQTMLSELLLDRQEKDGSWWDYPLYDYHQPYGTSFALMSLYRCRPTREDSQETRNN